MTAKIATHDTYILALPYVINDRARNGKHTATYLSSVTVTVRYTDPVNKKSDRALLNVIQTMIDTSFSYK